jgi:hypothetical protein
MDSFHQNKFSPMQGRNARSLSRKTYSAESDRDSAVLRHRFLIQYQQNQTIAQTW